MDNITIIIPIHKFDDTYEGLFKKAINSVNSLTYKGGYRIFLVGPSELVEKAKTVATSLGVKRDISLIENDETDFYCQVNKGVYSCVTPFFTILEIDDEFAGYWLDVFDRYEKYHNASIYIPVNELVENGKVVSTMNEIVLGASFADDEKGIGFITGPILEQYALFNLTGAVFKTEDFISLGCLKPSLKTAAWYEFMLRAAYNNYDIYVVPKIGYRHTVSREDSYMAETNNSISKEEGAWLFDTAKQEYFFKEDRNKKFSDQ